MGSNGGLGMSAIFLCPEHVAFCVKLGVGQ